MKPETFKRACELADIRVITDRRAPDWVTLKIEGIEGYLHNHNAAHMEVLLPLVAERLVKRVYWPGIDDPKDYSHRFAYCDTIDDISPGERLFKSAKIRILAALVALGERTIEEARAEL